MSTQFRFGAQGQLGPFAPRRQHLRSRKSIQEKRAKRLGKSQMIRDGDDSKNSTDESCLVNYPSFGPDRVVAIFCQHFYCPTLSWWREI